MSQLALAELYVRQAPRARNLAFLLTGDRVPAEDLVQDCFVKLAGRVRPVDYPEADLRRMVVNDSHSHHRKLRVRCERARDEAVAIGADTNTSADGADARADCDRLLLALGRLPQRRRTIAEHLKRRTARGPDTQSRASPGGGGLRRGGGGRGRRLRSRRRTCLRGGF